MPEPMRDPLQQFDYEPGITVAKPESLLKVRDEIMDRYADLVPLIAKLALKTDDPADTARIIIDRETETLRFLVERAMMRLL